jgi:HEAT repeat protein
MVLLCLSANVGAAGVADFADAEAVLRQAKVPGDGPALLAFFRQRTLTPTNQARLADLIKKLGHDDFATRLKAHRELLAAGPSALDLLRHAEKNPDPEIARRAQRIVAQLNAGDDLTLLAAAARVLGQRKPAGAVQGLLAYLPFVHNEDVEEAMFDALAAAGLSGGKADPPLTRALTAQNPALRSAAAFVLARLPRQRPAVRRLLSDSKVKVRFHAARALFLAGDHGAVGVLIGLLEKGPNAWAWKSEELLCRLLGHQEPPATLRTASKSERRECAAAWRKWWEDNERWANLARLPTVLPVRNLFLVCFNNEGLAEGEVTRPLRPRPSGSRVSSRVGRLLSVAFGRGED